MNSLKQSFDKIYTDNYIKVFTFIYNLSADRILTEDILQEAFIKAYNKIDSFRQESNILHWLNKIAYNSFLDYKRKKFIKNTEPCDEYFLLSLRETGQSLLKEVEQKIMSECVQSKLMLIPENYRAPLFLDIQGYNNQEIAEIINCSLDNVKIRLHRAKKKMKEILGSDCNFYYDERNVLC